MGRATIEGGGEDGLYTAVVQYETRWAAAARESLDKEIEELEKRIEELDEGIREANEKIEELSEGVGTLSNIYNQTVAAQKWTKPTHPDRGDGLKDFDYSNPGGGWAVIISEVWAPDKRYTAGARVVPLKQPSGNHYLCLEEGISGAVEPNWGRGRGTFTVDNSIVWECVFGLWVTQYPDLPDQEGITEFGGPGGKKISYEMKPVEYALGFHELPDHEAVIKAFSYLIRALAEAKTWRDHKAQLEWYRKAYKLMIQRLELRKLSFDALIEEPEPQSMWCADLTEDLIGEVDTIEIKGAPDQILIGPAGASGYAQNKLAKVMAMSSAQAGLAWALLPGWQKHRPTYRVGTIHSINYGADTASVTLDPATSIAQELNINQGGTNELEAIPVEYMTCNADAFENGDRVVVEFPGQLWEQGPKVIGFETNPQPCGDLAVAFVLADGGGWLVADGLTWEDYRWFSIDPDMGGENPYLCQPRNPETDQPTTIELLPQIGIHDLVLDAVPGRTVTTDENEIIQPQPGLGRPHIGEIVGQDLSQKIGVAVWVNVATGAEFWFLKHDGSWASGVDQWGENVWAGEGGYIKCRATRVVVNTGQSWEGFDYHYRLRTEVETITTVIRTGDVVLLGETFRQTVTNYKLIEDGEGEHRYTITYPEELSEEGVRERIPTGASINRAISDRSVIPDLEEGANDFPGAVVRGVEGYTDNETYVLLYEAWEFFDGRWDGAGPPCNYLGDIPGPTVVQKMNLIFSGTKLEVDACPAVAFRYYQSLEYEYKPRMVNIYDFHGEPLFVFSFSKRRVRPIAEEPVGYYGFVWRGDLTLSDPFPGETIPGHISLDIHGSKASYGKTSLCVAVGVDAGSTVTHK